jgi:hypothetical protein
MSGLRTVYERRLTAQPCHPIGFRRRSGIHPLRRFPHDKGWSAVDPKQPFG